MSNLLAPASPFAPPSLLYVALTQPLKLLIRLLDLSLSSLRAPPQPHPHALRVVCISDTHCLTPDHVPDGDLLIHAGDLTNAGTPSEIQAQIDWLVSLPHEHKVVIAGNHDTWLDPRSRRTLSIEDQLGAIDWKGLVYLQHSTVTLQFLQGARELRVYGAPQIPACGGDEFAFQYPRGSDAWSETTPEAIDILVTHTPPKYHLDLPGALGCEHLLAETWNVRPHLHVFGHVHAGKTDTIGWMKGGKDVAHWDHGQRSLERALARRDGFIAQLINPHNWLDVARVLYYGVTGVLWDRIWGGVDHSRKTLLVNASLMYANTGQLRNPAQVVNI